MTETSYRDAVRSIDGPTVTLTRDELTIGCAVGCRRRIASIHSTKSAYPDDLTVQWQQHVEAACSEIAVAKHYTLAWTGMQPLARYDVDDLQVRSVDKPHKGLIFRDGRDHEEDLFVLVYAAAPNYVLLGWLYGHEIRTDAHLQRVPNPYWLAHNLHPMWEPEA